jgi:polar amino acid transport system permease protein
MNAIIQFLLNIVTLNGAFDWSRVVDNLFSRIILEGVIITIIIAVLSQLIGSVIGLLLYFARRSDLAISRRFVSGYVWFFRGTPLLVQILFLNELAPVLGLARPLIQLHVFLKLGFSQDIPVDAFIATCIALSLNEGAYMAEIVRAGIDAIDTGQMEAAKSLGMTYWLGMRRIVLPQALRVIVPPLGNEFNSMLKSTSLAYTIGVGDLLGGAKLLASSFAAPLELYTVAAFWYLALTTGWGFIQSRIERRVNASNIDPALMDRRSWWQRMTGLRGPTGGPTGGISVEAPVLEGERR